MHDTDKVKGGLMELFFGLFFRCPPWKFFYRRPCNNSLLKITFLRCFWYFRYNLTHLHHCEKTSVSVYRTLAEDQRCKPLRFLPADSTLRPTLVSFPGSGNTWVRHMIEQATGIYTGSMYPDEKSNAGI